MSEDVAIDFLQESTEFEVHVLNLETSIVFKGKTLQQWNQELAIPTVSTNQDVSITQLEMMHLKALNSIETVMSNLAIARSAYIAAKSNHEANMIRNHKSTREEIEATGKRPTNDFVQKLCEERCLNTFKVYSMSDLIYNFWNTQSYKLNQLNERLTSLNYTKRN